MTDCRVCGSDQLRTELHEQDHRPAIRCLGCGTVSDVDPGDAPGATADEIVDELARRLSDE